MLEEIQKALRQVLLDQFLGHVSLGFLDYVELLLAFNLSFILESAQQSHKLGVLVRFLVIS